MTEQSQSSVTARRMMLGARLRRLREQRGISRADAGYTIRASESKMSRLELGKVSFKERDVADLLVYYGVTDPAERSGVLSLLREANRPGWWRAYEDVLPDWFQDYIGLEQAATRIRTYETHFVPGLMQTDDYSRAVIATALPQPTEPEVERAVALRAVRKQLLTRPNGPHVWAVVEEAALRRPVGSEKVRRGQLEHLLDLATLGHITIQVLPLTRHVHAAAGGAFTMLRFGETDLPDVVYVEHLLSALYLDRPDHVSRYAEVMDLLCVEALLPEETVTFIGDLLTES
ncbi:MAG: helix-turn-helix domain-containing protein [Kineosporiaceae bacterium]|nr:helix-turn-helix domain-containing protein [Kineosporiaceae bacterium]MBK7622343.1 helix-turn-helix domain-containing protein [Kineosporiaceae bacterium]MBK8074671.1 helix-turn-helix domain-containing protein [Kineosporiaceae bacterium]